MASSLLIVFLLLLLTHFSLASDPILKSARILSDSGQYSSMALTLKLSSRTLAPQSTEGLPSLTIFAPSNAAFVRSPPPSLSLLQYHLLPLAFSFHSFKSLPFGAKISTLLEGRSLVVTTSPPDEYVSLNNVTVNRSPIYADGSLIIFGIDEFFDPLFRTSEPLWSHAADLEYCAASMPNAGVVSSFQEASDMMRSNGYSVMASFLQMQLLGFQEKSTKLTVFAPADEVIKNRLGSFSECSPSIFHRYVLPCRLLWGDLVNMEDGTVLRTYLEGFTINVTGSPGILELNDVPVIYPDLYFSDWLVVHGVRGILEAPGPPAEQEEQTESLQIDPGEDYPYQEPPQTEPVADFTQAEVQGKSPSSSGNSFEDNPTGHVHFSTFNFFSS